MKFPDADAVFARDTVVMIVRAIALKRAIEDAKPPNKANFWRVIMGGLYDTAIVDWCILFGSDNAQQQPLHWKNMFDAAQFRTDLLAALGASDAAWKAYRERLKAYRDENAAHRDLDPSSATYPNMDWAVEASYVYWQHLCDKLNKARPGYMKDDLRGEYDRCYAQFSEVAQVAVKAVAEMG